MPRPSDRPAKVGEHTVAEGVEPALGEGAEVVDDEGETARTVRHPDLQRALDVMDERLGTQD
jgi:hypothetical protein